MPQFLFIESRDEFTSADVNNWTDYLCRLSNDGNRVSVLYVNDGIQSVRQKAQTNMPFTLLACGVKVFVDSWSLDEKGISENDLVQGIQPVSLRLITDELENGSKIVWH